MFTSRSSRLFLQRCVRFNSTSPSFQEVRIPVPWGHVAGKWWGPTDKRPVLTLHGWQDNCGSFNRLLPLLNRDVGFLAIDLPGHGHSSRLPSGMYCYFTDYLILIRYLVNYFQWPKVSLMGHSMGGVNCFTYTMAYPKHVDFLICLDISEPLLLKNNMLKKAEYINNFTRHAQFEQSEKEPPSQTLEEIKRKLCIPNNNSVAYEHSDHLAERNIAPSKVSPGQYYFKRDPRLKGMDLMNWPQEEIVSLAKQLTCPMLIANAIDAPSYEFKENFYEVLDILKQSSTDCQYRKLEGTHHLHLNNPEVLADLVEKFIEKHDVEDRSVGGIKEEMKNIQNAASNSYVTLNLS